MTATGKSQGEICENPTSIECVQWVISSKGVWYDGYVNDAIGAIDDGKTLRLDWVPYLGVIISLGGATIVATKLLAVARWDPNSAFAILATSGTGDVLIGALLACMPTIITFALIYFAPGFELFISTKNPAERMALRLLQVSIISLVANIVSLFYLVSIVGAVILHHVVVFLSRRMNERRARKGKGQVANGSDQSVTALESRSFFVAMVLFALLGSLSVPWVPGEKYNTPTGESVGYVLGNADDGVYILEHEHRKVEKIEKDDLLGELCDQEKSFLTTPASTYFKPLRYEECPS